MTHDANKPTATATGAVAASGAGGRRHARVAARTVIRSARRCGAGACLAVVVGLVGAGGAVAVDDPSDGGLWYFSATGMDAIHQTTQGKGITIAVLDSQVNPAAPDLAGADITVHEPSYCAATPGGPALPAASTDVTAVHATGMDGVILGTRVGVNGRPGQRGIAPQASIRNYTTTYERGEIPMCESPAELAGKSGMASAIDQAVADGADIISMSISGRDDAQAFDAIGRALHAGVILVAAGPHGSGTTMKFPASANGVVAVESADPSFALTPETTTSPLLTVVAPGEHFLVVNDDWVSYVTASGSSNATAYTSAALALVWSAFPTATANQVLQSLVRNTDGTDHALQRDDSWGYGVVNVRQMLSHDPTAYPDINPLLRADGKPSTAQILGDGTTAPTTDAATGAGTGGSTASGARPGVSSALLVGGGIVLVVVLLIAAGVVVALVVGRRRRIGPGVPER